MDSTDIRTFDLDLDLPGKERWKPIFESYPKKDRDELINSAKALLSPYVSYLPMAKIALAFVPSSSMMYYEELVYIAEFCGLELVELLFLQLIYESSAACTTIVWQDSKGHSHFFRTMDWPMTFLKKWTIRVRYFKEGALKAEAITWLGLVGAFTIRSRVDDFAVAVNYRRTKETLEISDIVGNIARVVAMAFPIAYLVRNIVNKGSDYKETIERLCKEELISPCYFTIFHTKDITRSCVITRDAKPSDVPVVRYWNPKEQLCQTNCDWKYEAPNILFSVQRYSKVEQILSEDPVEGDDFLVFPIHNEEGIYAYFIDNEVESVRVL